MSKIQSFKLLGVLAGMIFSVASFAQDMYAGGNLASLDFSVDGTSQEASLTAVYGRLGTSFTDNISGEIRLGLGVGDDTIFGVDVELENMFGAYVRAGLPVTEVIYPYAVIGYTRGEVDVSGFSSESESDVSFGVGVDFGLGGGMAINLEYMNYLDKDGAEVDGFAIGFAKSF
ncbi:MAG: porin family protein [Cellvibrionaceae bacterium]